MIGEPADDAPVENSVSLLEAAVLFLGGVRYDVVEDLQFEARSATACNTVIWHSRHDKHAEEVFSIIKHEGNSPTNLSEGLKAEAPFCRAVDLNQVLNCGDDFSWALGHGSRN